jgi:hypothetical protein
VGVAESLFWILVILACRRVMATGRATTHVRRAGIKIVRFLQMVWKEQS